MKDSLFRKFLCGFVAVYMVFTCNMPGFAYAINNDGLQSGTSTALTAVDSNAPPATGDESANAQGEVNSLTRGLVAQDGNELSGGETVSVGGTYTLATGATGTITIGEGISAIVEGASFVNGEYQDAKYDGLYFVVGDGSTLTLKNVYINNGANVKPAVDFTGSGAFNIEGTNIIDVIGNGGSSYGGVHVGGGSANTVTFGGTGVLYLYKDTGAAGIGSTRGSDDPNGNIVFNSGTWNLKGTRTGPVIGNDMAASGMGTITVNGGELHVKSVSRGACIGGSAQGYAADVKIAGGLVECYVDFSGSAIGSGGPKGSSSGGASAGSLTVTGGSLKTVISPNAAGSESIYQTGNTEESVVSALSVSAETAVDSDLLVFDASAYAGQESVTVAVDGETFYTGAPKYSYLVNEIKNPTGLTSANFLPNTAASAFPEDVSWAGGYPSKDGSSFAPDANLYFFLPKTAHTITVGEDTYKYDWDATANAFVVNDFVDFATDIADETRGTEERPYRIGTEADLIAFREAINADTHAMSGTDTAKYAGKYFKLMNDIELAQPWVPVGISATKYFSGSFDGDGHTISGLNCTNESAGGNYLGLFGYVKTLSGVNVVIENVKVAGTVTDSSTSTSCGVGGIVGYAYPSTTTAAGAVPGYVTVENCVSDVSLKGGRNVGGIAGYANTNVNVKNCLVLGDIEMSAKGTNAASYGGGLVGVYNTTGAAPTVANNLFLGQINTTDATMGTAESGNAAANFLYTCNALVGRYTMSNGQTEEANLANVSNNHYAAQSDTRVQAYRASISGDTQPTEPSAGTVVAIPATAEEQAALVTLMAWPGGSLAAANVPIDRLGPALKSGAALKLTSTDEEQWTVDSDNDGRTWIQSGANGANVSATITSEKAGWVIFEWGFTGSGNWKDRFTVSMSGDTTSSDYIGANSSSNQGRWVTKVVPVNAGTTTVTWTSSNTDGALTTNAWLDEIRFVDAKTPVTVTADEHTTAQAVVNNAAVTEVEPGAIVRFEASGSGGYLFKGWKVSADATEDVESVASFAVTVYDEPVSYYAYSEKPFDGLGTEEDPFLIKSLADLETLASYVGNGTTFAGQFFKLENDIDANGAEFAGIGTGTSSAFAGTFDGNGKTVSNIKLTGEGLFNITRGSAVIQNLTVEGNLVAAANNAGMVVGTLYGTIKNVTSKGTIASAKEYVGGLVGNLGGESTVTECASEVAITATYEGYTQPAVGGLVGQASNNTAITNSTFTGSIDGSTVASIVGGILGKSGSGTTVSGCIAVADLNGNARIGGIAGSADATRIEISNCEYHGNVTGVNNVGGIIGYLYGSWSPGTSSPSVQSSLATGTVTATDGNAGGIAGVIDRAASASNNLALQQSISGKSANRIAAFGTQTTNTVLSGNAAWSGMAVNEAVVADDAATAVADGVDGAAVSTETLQGEATYDPTTGWSAEAWTVAAAAKPQLKTTDAVAELSTDKYPLYALGLNGYKWYLDAEGDEYAIATAEELAELASVVNGTVPAPYGIAQDGFAGKTVTLAADIDLSENTDWAPIGGSDAAFAGTFDGAGKAITGLAIASSGSYKGLFGNNHGTVKDFTLAGSVSVSGSVDFVGAVAGFNSGTIENVQSSVTISAPSAYNVGGIAGLSTSGKWVNGSGATQVIDGSKGLIAQCSTSGSITGSQKVGGIVGENAGTVKLCSSSATVDGTNASSKNGVGGIAGRNGNNNTAVETGTIDSCYFSGTVGRSGQKWVGGIAGFSNGRYGLGADDPKENSSVTNCVMVGTLVSGGGYDNAIVGNQEGSASNNYALEGYPNTGTTEAEIGIVKSAADMKADSLVLALNAGLEEGAEAAWNADNSGANALNGGFPVLAWQGGRKVIDPALPWDGTIDISWYDASASEYHISTPAQLAGVAALVNGMLWNGVTADSDKFIAGDNASLISQLTCSSAWSGGTRYYGAVQSGDTIVANDFNGKTVYLDNDIDMGGVQAEDGTWSGAILAPIGGNWQYGWDEEKGIAIIGPDSARTRTLDAGFSGVFDGQGHYVNNAIITVAGGGDSDNVGLIGSLGIDAYVTFGTGRAADYWPAELAVRNVGITGYVYGGRSVGGIVGKTYNTVLGNTQAGAAANPTGDGHPVIENCVNRATVKSTDKKGVGGVVGAFWNNPLLYNCYSTGTVSGGTPQGSVVGGTEGPLYNVYSTQTNIPLAGESAATRVNNGYRIGVDVTEEAAKEAAFADSLGWAYVADTNNINNGYPILFWEAGISADDLLKDISSAVVTVEPNQEFTFTGSAIKPAYTVVLGEGEDAVTLTEGTDFTATYENNTNVGTAKLVKIDAIEGVNGYTGSVEVNAEYAIVQRSIEGATFAAIPTQWSDGTTAPEPALTARLASPSALLKLDQDYTVVYAGNVATAENPTVTATATLTGTGNYTGTATAEFEVRYMDSDLEGSGTAEDPYVITSGEELEFVSQMVNNADAEVADRYATAAYKIGADFTATNIDPVGLSAAKPFKGTIDGDGHTITMDQTRNSQYTALVGYANSTADDAVEIKDLTIDGSVASTSNYTAAFVGYASGTGLNVTNCVNKATIGASGSYKAGIVAYAQGANSISKCTNEGAISGGSYVAGILGYGGGTIEDCANSGALTATSSYTAGILGYGGSETTIERCYNVGAIDAKGYTGGIVGNMGAKGTLTDVYNNAAVSGTNCVGGIVGRKSGNNSGLTITNAYVGQAVTGTGTGINAPGGIVGYFIGSNSANTLTNAYWLADSPVAAFNKATTATCTVEGEPTALDAAGLQALAPKLGENFKADLGLVNDGYPVLTWQDSEWYNTTDTEFTVSNAAQLAEFASIVNGTNAKFEKDSFAGKTVTLAADIALAEDGLYTAIPNVTYGASSYPMTTTQYVLNEEAPIWTPIGSGTATNNTNATVDNAFAGTFDGAGHTVSGVYTGSKDATVGNTDTVQGLFGVVSGTVKNLTVSGCIAGKIVVGGVAAQLSGGTIENCTNNAVVFADGGQVANSGNETGPSRGGAVGGIVGNAMGGIVGNAMGGSTVQGCTNNAVVICANTAKGGRAGGIIGLIDNAAYEVAISKNANTGNIESYQYAGGIVGMNASRVAPISECYNTGDITGYSSGSTYVGGIASQCASDVSLCYNTGDISIINSGKAAHLGGIVSDFSGTKVENCYNLGNTAASSSYGAIVGTGYGSAANNKVVNCYALEGVGDKGEDVNNGCTTVATEAEMKTALFVAKLHGGSDGFNMSEDGYPVLAWQGGTPVFAISLELGEHVVSDSEALVAVVDGASMADAVVASDNSRFAIAAPTVVPADAGITVTANDDRTFTVSGTPTASVTITFADAAVSKLGDALEKADAAKADVLVSEDGVTTAEGEGVPEGASYVTPSEYKALQDVIDAAQAVCDDPAASEIEISNAAWSLRTAVSVFTSSIRAAVVDKTEIDAALEAAATDLASVAVSEDGADLAPYSTYVTAETKAALEAVIDVATTARMTEGVTQAAIDQATADLNAAVKAFDEAKQTVEPAASDVEAAQGVIGQIAALPAPDAVTAANVAAIEAAQTAFDNLTPEQKALVTNADKLATASAVATAVTNAATAAEEAMARAACTEAGITYDADKTAAENLAAATEAAKESAAEAALETVAKAACEAAGIVYDPEMSASKNLTAATDAAKASAAADAEEAVAKAACEAAGIAYDPAKTADENIAAASAAAAESAAAGAEEAVAKAACEAAGIGYNPELSAEDNVAAASEAAAEAAAEEAAAKAACEAAGIKYDNAKTPAQNQAAASDAVKAACEAAGVAYDPAKSASENLAAANAANASEAAEAKKEAAEAKKEAAEAKKTDLSKATLKVANATYTGRKLTPTVTVMLSNKTLVKDTDYTVDYANNKNAGSGVAMVIGKGSYTGAAFKTFKIAKAKNKMTVKAKTAKVKAAKVKKSNVNLKVSKVLTVKNAKGAKSYKKVKGNKKITIDSTTGKVTVAKGLKKATYKVKVKVTAAGNANFKKLTKTVTFKVKVA